MEDVPVEKQTDFLSSLLSPLCQQVSSNALKIWIAKCLAPFLIKDFITCLYPLIDHNLITYLIQSILLIMTWLFAWFKLLCLDQIETLIANAKVQNPEESPAKIWNIQQIIMAINALSKVLIAFNLLYFLRFAIIDRF